MSKSGDDASAPAKISSSKIEDLPSSQDTSDGQNSTPKAKPLDIQFQKRFSVNLVSNIIYFILNIIVGLCLTPFFLHSLGDAAYALVPLATSVTGYVTLIVSCLNGVVSRYLTLDLQRGETDKANVTYNTAMFGTLAVVLIILPISLILAWCVPYLFNTESVDHVTVFLLFGFVFLSALIRTWTSTFQTTLFAYNRLDLWNWVNAAYLLFQVGIVVVLFALFGPSLISIGVSYVISAIISGLLAAVFSKRTDSSLRFKISLFDKSLFGEMGKMTGWFLVQQFGSMLMLPVCLIIVNISFGAAAETQFSLAQTFATLMVSLAGLVTSLFMPQIYSYVAKQNFSEVASFLKFSIKVVGLTLALPITLVCLFSPQLLTIWIGAEYTNLMPLVCLLTIPTIFWIQSACAGSLNVACNRVKVTAVVCVFAGGINIGLGFALPAIFDIGYYGVAIAWIISLLIQKVIFGWMYVAYIIHAPILIYYKPVLVGFLAVAILFIAGSAVFFFIPTEYLVMRIIVGVVISLIYLAILVKLLLNRNEREMIRSCLPAFVSKIIPRRVL